MTTVLTKYEEGRQALAAAHQVDEVKAIRDKAVALAEYARQAKDTELLTWVTEIRLRAERRTGELLRDMEKNPGSPGPGRGRKTPYPAEHRVLGVTRALDVKFSGRDVPTLKQLGITAHQSSAWQKLAKIPESEFERRMKTATNDSVMATTAKILRPPSSPNHSVTHRKPKTTGGDALKQALEEGKEWARRWRHLPTLAPVIVEFLDLLNTHTKEMTR